MRETLEDTRFRSLATVLSDARIPSEVDVVVVGGGIVGVSTALNLAERGFRVCVCEKGRVAAEQSSRNWGWVRQMGRDPAEMPLAIESLRIWRNLNERFEIETGFRETGISYLCRNARETRNVERWAETGKKFGLAQSMLGPAQISELLPGATPNFSLGLHTASDGRAEPAIAVSAIAKAAIRLGATIVENCAARGIETQRGCVFAAVTEKGLIRCNSVVVAGGVWSRLFLGNLDIDFPQLKILATAARIGDVSGVPDMPVGGGDFAFRRRLDNGFTAALRNTNVAPLVPDSLRLLADFLPAVKRHWHELRLSVGRQFVTELVMPRRWSLDATTPFERFRILDPAPRESLNRKMLKTLRQAFPAFAQARITHAWAGLIEATPDEIPVIDGVDEIPGLYLASGFSGHGFGTGPAAGQLMAQLVARELPCVDPSPFRLSRFGSTGRESSVQASVVARGD